MAKGCGAERQVKEVADHDVEEDTEVIGIEIFVCGWSGEEKVEEFENQELKRGFALAVEEEYDVLTKGFESVPVEREGVYYLIR